MLKGNNILLRPFKRSDVERVIKWLNDSEVTKYLMTYLPVTETAGEKFIEEFIGDPKRVFFIIEAVEGGSSRPIGMTDLGDIHPKDHKASFGICIGETDYWSKGYGTEAARLLINYGFEQLNLHRIDSDVIAYNERSLRMHRSIGFRDEGCKKEAEFKNGKYHNVLMFGILKEEWRGLESAA